MGRLAPWAAIGGAVIGILSGPAAARSHEAAPARIAEAVLQHYVLSWDHADAQAIAGAFAHDGDFISPDGLHARGPGEIEAFYQGAFARGYAGSTGRFSPRVVRRLAPGVIAVDGEWSITGARDAQGRPRPPESGIATAVLVEGPKGWQVGLLREQAGAKRISP